jgi:glucokinase
MTESQEYAIGVDLGGTKLRAALIDTNGKIHNRREVMTKAKEGPETVLAQIKALVEAISNEAGGHQILGVGVSSPGPLDTKTGTALSIPTLRGFENYPLKNELSKLLETDVLLENDGIAAAIGEWKYGVGKGYANLVYATVSTGIGGGVICNNTVIRGRRGMAGHIGHMILVQDGALCNCGARGCFEAYGAGPAFVARAKMRAGVQKTSALTELAGEIDSLAIFAAARAGDQLAIALILEEANILGTGFASLAHLFSPDIIVMGGGLSNEFAALAPTINKRFQSLAMPAFKDIKVVRATLGENSGLIGAASLVFGVPKKTN